MVRVQMLAAVRPGELVHLRTRDLDMTGDVWVTRPDEHKTAHLEHERPIAFGPRAQAILAKYIRLELDAYLFSPAEQAKLIRETKRKARKTPVQPSQLDRSCPTARPLQQHFSVTGYNRAIRRACLKAGVDPWHAHQLRHTANKLIRRERGAEAARATLGHSTIDMTAHYGGVDEELAVQVARAMG